MESEEGVEGHIRVYQEPQGINYAYATLARATSTSTSTVVVSFSNLRLAREGKGKMGMTFSPLTGLHHIQVGGTWYEIRGKSKLK